MKKLSLLLALVMLCGCFILAACGGETAENSSATSSATSSVASEAASSEAPSTPAESSEDPASTPDEGSEPVSEDPNLPEPQMFWVSHYDDGLAEAAGSVFSTTDLSGGWWTHVSFKPVEDKENVYEIVEISVGVGTGAAQALAVPEGGFVYGINIGNDWPSIVASDPVTWAGHENEPNYTNDNTFSMVAAMGMWKIGDQLLIQGVDFENFSEVPTTTPDTPYYEEGYVCTATWQKVN